jgi:hypothetical protein
MSPTMKSWRQQHYASQKEAVRCRHLQKLYGITQEDYSVLYEAQGGRCQICNTPKDVLNVDHNHATGDVRGLLCHPCNQGIGLLKDSPGVLLKAFTYLNDNGYYGPKEA